MTGKIVKAATLKQKLAKESKRWLVVGVASAALGLVVMSQSNVASAADDPSAETTQPAAQTQDVTINQKTSTNVVDQNGNQLASQSSPSRFDLTVMDSGLITAVRDSDVKGQITDKVPAGSKLDSVTLTLTNTGKMPVPWLSHMTKIRGLATLSQRLMAKQWIYKNKRQH